VGERVGTCEGFLVGERVGDRETLVGLLVGRIDG
jgi:hypothetical protein